MIALPSPLAPLSRLLQPFAPAWVQDAWPRAAQSRLAHCLLLALLLHVWLVLMLGNAPPGTAPPGQGVWGALNVTLRGPAQDGPVAALAPPNQPAGLPGTAASPRIGGVVRAPSAPALPDPGAARRGDWAATPAASADLPTAGAPPLEPIGLPPPVALAPQPLPQPVPVPAIRLPMPQALPDAPPRVPPPTAPAPAAAPALQPAVAAPAPPALPAAVATPATPAEAVPAAPVLRQVAPLAAAAAPPASALAPVQGLPVQAQVGLPSLPAGPTGTPLGALPAGRPDAGPLVGHDVATAPSAPASAPRLNLELARPRGGELSRQAGAGGVLPLLPRPPELPDKLARDIDKAAKADCRKAYQGMGVLAVVPLAVDAVRGGKDSGCKW